MNLKNFANSALKMVGQDSIRILFRVTYPKHFKELTEKEKSFGMFYGSAIWDGKELFPDDGDTYEIDEEVISCSLEYDKEGKEFYLVSLEEGEWRHQD